MRLVRRVLQRPFVAEGVAAGCVGATLFVVLHAFVVKPIWVQGLVRGPLVAVFGGALAGFAYGNARPRLRFRGAAGGALWGLLIALPVVAVAGASTLRIAHESSAKVVGVLAALLGATLIATFAAHRPGPSPFPAWVWTAGAALLLNAYPAYVVLFLDRLVTDHVPRPWPMSLTLVGIYVVAGLFLATLAGRRDRASSVNIRPASPL